MLNGKTFTKLALSFPGTEQVPHFDRIGFKITGRRMFATYLEKDNTANVFLSPQEQALFCRMDEAIYPVPNKWGEKGATTFDLSRVPQHILTEALLSAYNAVMSPKKPTPAPKNPTPPPKKPTPPPKTPTRKPPPQP